MKKFYLTLIFLILFLSSCDNRLFIATSFVEDSLELQDIDVLSTDFSSISIPIHDSNALKKLLEFLKLKEEYETTLSNYIKTHFSEQKRVWMRTMTKEQLATYKKLQKQYWKLESNSLPSIFYQALLDKEKYASVWIKYKKENSDSIKYGVFYFNEKGEIKNHIIFNEDTYSAIKGQAETYKKIGVVPRYTAPSFDSFGLDIVPEDEDPSKTREERIAIKEKETEGKERADMMKKNPILRTFYGATLGTKSVRTIVNRLRNKGYEIEEYATGQYFCQNYYDYFEGAFGAEGSLCREYLEKLSVLICPSNFRVGGSSGVEEAALGDMETQKKCWMSNQEVAEKAAQIPAHLANFLPVIDRNIALATDPARMLSWRYLKYHSRICGYFAELLLAGAEGRAEDAEGKYYELEEYLSEHELEFHNAFDVALFLRALRLKLGMKPVEMYD